jgi:hypothetical protein
MIGIVVWISQVVHCWLKISGLAGLAESTNHLSKACALRLTSLADIGCTVPSSSSLALSAAFSNHRDSISLLGGDSVNDSVNIVVTSSFCKYL